MRSGRRVTKDVPALVALSLGFGVVQLDVTVVNVAVNRIGASIGGGVTAMQWVVSAYTVAFAAFILTAGACGDRIGAKRLFIGGFVLFTAASAACAAAPSVVFLIVARVIQGVGAAVLVPCSLALLNHTYTEPHRRAWAVGWWAAGASIALAAGPLVGGVLIALVSWRAIFLINLPLGAFAIWLTMRHLEETPRQEGRGLDLPGQVAGVLGLGLLATAMIEGGATGFGNPGVLAGFGACVLAWAAFVAIESRARRPMLPLSLFGERTFGSTAAIGLLVNVCVYGLIFVFSLMLQRQNGLSPLGTGLAFLPMTVAVGVTNVVAGRLAGRTTARALITTGLAFMAVACGLLIVTASDGYVLTAIVLAGLGAGAGLLVPPLTSALLGSVPRQHSGIASATLNSMRQTGSVIGVALFGSLIAGHGQLTPGTRLALAVSIGVLVAASWLTVRVRA
jgi:MFS transporter, DHA2 family, methylenomycin A resistance protein